MKDSPSPPPAPDYTGAAIAQGSANVDAARIGAKMNNPNVIGPTGSQTVTWQDDIPTITQQLAPNAQQALEAQQRTQMDLSNLGEQGIGTAQHVLGSAFDPNLPGVQTQLGNGGPINTAINTSGLPQAPVNAGMTGQQAIMSRLEPQIAQQEAATRQRMANQGLVAGGEAYDNEMRNQGQQFNDLRTQAALQGIGLDTSARQNAFNEASQQAQFGNAGQNQEFNQGLQGAQFGNQAQQQSLAQQLALRNQPLNEITALMSGGQVQMPQFQGYQGQNVAPAPVFGAQQAQSTSNLQNYGIKQAGVNSNNAGLYGLLGAGLMAM